MSIVLFCFLLFSASVHSYGIQAYLGVSCQFDNCIDNLTSAAITLGQCSNMCNPCDPTACQYQTYRAVLGGGVEQLLCGADSTCGTCSSFQNYTCGTCANLSSIVGYPFGVTLTCPVERVVGGTVSCGALDCVTNNSNALAVINKCYYSCNPCNPTQCLYASYVAEGTTLKQIQYTDGTCDPATGVLINTFTCGQCANNFSTDLAVTIPCPATSTADISSSLNDVVAAAAVASLINADPRIPSGTVVNTPTGSSIVDGVLSFALSVVSPANLGQAEIDAIKVAIAESIAAQFNIVPVTRVSVNWAKKRDVQATNTVTVIILNNGASFPQLPILVLSAIMLLWGLL